MEESSQSLIDRRTLGIVLVLAILFHLFSTTFLRAFVPTNTPSWQWFWSFFCSLPLTGTFFLAASMFCLVLTDQRQRKP